MVTKALRSLPAWVGLLALTPLAALAIGALTGDDGGATRALAATRLIDMTTSSMLLVFGATLGVSCIGAGLAWLVCNYRFPGRGWFDWVLMLPLAAPSYVLAYAYLDLTQAAGPLQSALRDATGWRVGDYLFPEVVGLPGAILIFSLCLYPYVYALARSAFNGSGGQTRDAARLLGCTGAAVFWRVGLPMARPAVAAGAALAAMETLADYGAVAHLGVSTYTVGIMRAWSSAGEPIAAARLAVVLVVICLALLWIERAARGRGERFADAASSPPSLIQLSPVRAWVCSGLCLLVLTLALVVPTAYLLSISLDAGPSRGLTDAVVRTLLLAITAAVILTLVGFGIASATRSGSPMARATQQLMSAGYATPGAAAALGILMLVGAVSTLLPDTSIIVAAGPALLIAAYQCRFGSAAQGSVAAALSRHPSVLDEAARTLGCSETSLIGRVHWPLARTGLLTGALLAFVEVVKELPATIILRPFDFDTLAVLAHGYASEERLAQAASPALAIVLVCAPAMIAVAWLTRQRSLEASANRPTPVGAVPV